MIASGGGNIIFVGDSAVGQGKPFWGAYGIAKLGLAGLAHMLQAESENFGLRSEVFTPGPMRTPIRLRAYPGEHPDSLPAPDRHADAILERLARPPFKHTL